MNNDVRHDTESPLDMSMFTPEQVQLLQTMRDTYRQVEQQRTLAEYRRLEFLRYLVATGRVSD